MGNLALHSAEEPDDLRAAFCADKAASSYAGKAHSRKFGWKRLTILPYADKASTSLQEPNDLTR